MPSIVSDTISNYYVKYNDKCKICRSRVSDYEGYYLVGCDAVSVPPYTGHISEDGRPAL
jgi:hypothetical protein